MIATVSSIDGRERARRVRSDSIDGGSGRAASLRRRAQLLRHRLPVSPYVGWFRHAPPASSSSAAAAAPGSGGGRISGRPRARSVGDVPPAPLCAVGPRTRPSSAAAFAPSSLGMRSSPHIGFFRHAPPSRVRIPELRGVERQQQRLRVQRAQTLEMLGRLSDLTLKMSDSSPEEGDDLEKAKALGQEVEEFLESLRLPRRAAPVRRAYYVDGKLRGGRPLHDEDGCDYVAGTFSAQQTPMDHRRIFDSIHQSASTHGLHFNDFSDDAHSQASDLASSSSGGDRRDPGGFVPGSPSATLGVLNRLAHWFLFPLAHDAYGYGAGDFAKSCDAADALYGRVGSTVGAALFPLFSALLRRVLLIEDGAAAATAEADPHGADDDARCDDDGGGSSSSVSSEAESEDDDDTIEDDEAKALHERTFPTSGGERDASRLLDVSVSSLAEAYYAHQASKELIDAETEHGGVARGASPPMSSQPPSSSSATPEDELRNMGHPLDYVITQIDIARMVRNASRHLDVESILSLPTVTYRGNGTKKKAATNEDANTIAPHRDGADESRETRDIAASGAADDGGDVGWSWMIVSPDPDANAEELSTAKERKDDGGGQEPWASTSSTKGEGREGQEEPSAPEHRGDEDDVNEHCVICLEHFVEGDRLRVLPCSHLFHVGCIDRWLSGAASDEECFTAGCPTCKEHPVSGGGADGRAFRCGEEEEELARVGVGSAGIDAAAAVGSSSDGSVPSWAFARLGDAMARR